MAIIRLRKILKKEHQPVQSADMAKPRILLTGDDGYQSHGTRLLIKMLRDDYDLTVCGTVTQQSAVGGKVSLASGFKYGKKEVDGIPAYWVEGTPVDAIEIASSLFDEPFDFAVSGINWGANLGTAVYSSGTVNAAVGAIARGASKQSIAISWDLPPEFYTMHHDKDHSIEEYFEYPGQVTKKLLTFCIENKLWGADWLNINLPQQPSNKVKLSQMVVDVQQIYDYSTRLKDEEGHYSFLSHGRVFSNDLSEEYDVRALTDGYISISPCKLSLVDQEKFERMKTVEFALG
jgi:5'-nucleotidase